MVSGHRSWVGITLAWCLFAACTVSRDLSPGRFEAEGPPPDSPDSGIVEISCEDPFTENEACGGDLVGFWYFIGSCGPSGNQSAILQSCPSAQITRDEVRYEADGFKFNLTTLDVLNHTREWLIEFSYSGESCGPCQNRTIAGLNTSCSPSGTSCNCIVGEPSLNNLVGLSYTVEGNIFTISNGFGSFYYCVEGDVLHLRREDCSAGEFCEHYDVMLRFDE